MTDEEIGLVSALYEVYWLSHEDSDYIDDLLWKFRNMELSERQRVRLRQIEAKVSKEWQKR